MKKYSIAVIGLGQGGMVAAYHLAKAGHEVTIYESKKFGEVSYPWTDDMAASAFPAVGLPMPPAELYAQTSTLSWISPDQKSRLDIATVPEGHDIAVSRRELSVWLAGELETVGVTIHYGTTVKSLVVRGNAVVGIRVGRKKVSADLVIDATGIMSPFRAQVPDKFRIQEMPAADDYLITWRALYRPAPGTPSPAYPKSRTNFYFLHNGGAGLSWCNLSTREQVDILIGRFIHTDEAETAELLQNLKENHPMLTADCVVPGQYYAVSTRYPLSRMVADGYATVGDSAFMTIPLIGSGLEASMKAGKLLADTVLAAERLVPSGARGSASPFTAKALWPYQVAFYQGAGSAFAAIDVLKRHLLELDPSAVDWFFGKAVPRRIVRAISRKNTNTGLFQGRLEGSSQDRSLKLPFWLLFELLPALLLDLPPLLFRLLTKKGAIPVLASLLKDAFHAFRTAHAIPVHYLERHIDKWQDLYEACFTHKTEL